MEVTETAELKNNIKLLRRILAEDDICLSAKGIKEVVVLQTKWLRAFLEEGIKTLERESG